MNLSITKNKFYKDIVSVRETVCTKIRKRWSFCFKEQILGLKRRQVLFYLEEPCEIYRSIEIV